MYFLRILKYILAQGKQTAFLNSFLCVFSHFLFILNKTKKKWKINLEGQNWHSYKICKEVITAVFISSIICRCLI
jgi:hypothetical protein